MTKFSIRKECLPYFIILCLMALLTYYFIPIISIVPLSLALFVLFFFRDPNRKIDYDDKIVLSPADGKVMSITEFYDDTFINGKVKKVTIFLSLFNVHINRSPISGKVTYINYRPGKYLPAFKSHASEINERNTVGIENDNLKVLVHQITGFVARRIVCWCKVGDELKQGEKFGLIKFGSCTEIIVPYDVDIKVKQGDTVKAGITIIGVTK